jgi:hypothetical protein
VDWLQHGKLSAPPFSSQEFKIGLKLPPQKLAANDFVRWGGGGGGVDDINISTPRIDGWSGVDPS